MKKSKEKIPGVWSEALDRKTKVNGKIGKKKGSFPRTAVPAWKRRGQQNESIRPKKTKKGSAQRKVVHQGKRRNREGGKKYDEGSLRHCVTDARHPKKTTKITRKGGGGEKKKRPVGTD